MHDDRSVDEMANEVLMRQAKARADRTGESIEVALEAVLNTKAGAQLKELRDAPHDEESVEKWPAKTFSRQALLLQALLLVTPMSSGSASGSS